VNEIMSGYEQSPGSQYQQQRMSQQLANTAGAGGFRGTGMEGSQQAELLQGLLSGDMQQWLQNIMQTQGQGLQGLEQSTDRGYNATEGIGNVLDREGGMAAQGAVNSNERRAALMKALGQAAGMAVGGPMASGAGGHAMSGIFGGGNVQGSPEATQYGQQFGGRMAGDIFGAF